jgi:thiol-disulfide isomerase/thioredoxin
MALKDLFSSTPLLREGHMPELVGATDWLNTEALTNDELLGKVVAVDFWTHTCINWLRTLPYLRAWSEHYSPHGLVVIGVHTPEFSIEHDVETVRRVSSDLGVEYAIAIDNDYAVWNAFGNQYWPALYIADSRGDLRYHHFGEGAYDRSEHVIRRLLEDAGAQVPAAPASVETRGIERSADRHEVRSPETYVGAARSQGFSSPDLSVIDEPHDYTVPDRLHLNQWALSGNWILGDEAAVCDEPHTRIQYRFHARDVNLILAPPTNGSAQFRVRLDGQPPGSAHGLDIDDEGNGVVTDARLYQLIRQPGRVEEQVFEIELLEPGTAAYCFTFG